MRKMRTVASAAEMRELMTMGVLEEYNVGPSWVSFSGAPNEIHIRWNSESFGFVYGSEDIAQMVRDWIQTELHTGNE
jgi:hypothetical protein